MKILKALAFPLLSFGLGLLINVLMSAAPKPAPIIVKKTFIKCVRVHPDAVQETIIKVCSEGYLLKSHLDKLGYNYHNASETLAVTLYFEK